MKKVLFIRSDRFGEFLCSLPAIKLVKTNYPQSKVYVLARKPNIELSKDLDFIDYLLEFKQDSFTGYRGARKLAELLKKEAIDCVVVLNPKKEFHLACFLAKVPMRVGYNRKWGFCLNNKIKDKKYQEKKHEVDYNIDLVKLICDKLYVYPIDFPVDNLRRHAAIKGIIDPDKKYIVVHPFTSNPRKKISYEFWKELTTRLKDSCDKEIILVGGDDDKEDSIRYSQNLGVKNITGKMNLRGLASFLKNNCFVFIGLDSGPMHLSSILDKPAVGLFTISNPVRWGPWSKDSLAVKVKDEQFSDDIESIISFVKDKVK